MAKSVILIITLQKDIISMYRYFDESLRKNDMVNHTALNNGAIKRTKITEQNYKYYIEILDLFFTFIKSGKIKCRIMFSPNDQLLINQQYDDNTFTKFYYTFIINAFSIFYANKNINLRLIFDDLPETKSKCHTFKKALITKIKTNKKPNANKVFINKNKIEEVDSKKHPILQCVDVITGCIDFYLNDRNSNSKRAKAKLKVCENIINHIKEIKRNFNLTKTTGTIYSHNGWKSVYKHFVYEKKIKNKTPNTST